MATDTEVIIHSLQKERDDLHDKIMQIDRILARIRKVEYGNPDDLPVQQAITNPIVNSLPIDHKASFPKTADIKIQVLRIFDILSKACQLAEVQQEFTSLTETQFKIRETVRSLHATGVLKMLKYRYASRGFMWIKREWIENGQLMDKYKPLGFDLLYSPENLTIV